MTFQASLELCLALNHECHAAESTASITLPAYSSRRYARHCMAFGTSGQVQWVRTCCPLKANLEAKQFLVFQNAMHS